MKAFHLVSPDTVRSPIRSELVSSLFGFGMTISTLVVPSGFLVLAI